MKFIARNPLDDFYNRFGIAGVIISDDVLPLNLITVIKSEKDFNGLPGLYQAG